MCEHVGVTVRERILQAATHEFARAGLAGARIDRIAAAAHASKERLYAHFAGKDGLFAAVLENNIEELSRSVRLEDDDLPGFAAALTLHASTHPEHLRIIDWARIEGGEAGHQYAALHESHMSRYREAIARAQDAGRVDASWRPDELLGFVFAIAMAWAHDPGGTGTASAEAARRAIARIADPQVSPA